NSYVALENYDSDWPENHIPDDDAGNLYRCTYYDNGSDPRTWADLDYKANMTEYRKNYRKQTNSAQDDYSDLLNLIDILNNPGIPDANFLSEVNKVLDLEQWTRYLAADALAGNREGGLTDGRGDDFAMYRGVEDPRFWLLPHDLDTMLGQGDHDYRPEWDIFNYILRNGGVNGLERLMIHPDFVKLYYNQYEELIHTVFALENVYPLVDRLLADWVSDSEINGSNGIKDFLTERIDSILYGGYPLSGDDPQIPQQFTINSSLPVVNGFHQTNTDVAVFDGTANAIKTSSVLVNGHLADFSALDGVWSIGESSGAVIKEITLVAENAAKKVLVPTGPIDPSWKSDPNFADSGWIHGTPTIPGKTGGVGYERGSGYGNYITYDVEAEMHSNNATCYVRIPFTIDPCDLAGLNFMTLKMRYDDGFVAYINGQRVEGVSEPSPLLWNSDTLNTDSHEAGASFNEYPISDDINSLQPGKNVLAIHGLNVSTTSSDFIISAKLDAGIMGQPFDGVALNPGINRIMVQTFDELNGTGSELERGFVDVWYNDGDDVDISGTLASNTTLDAASGPWHITSELTVPSGITLTVLPGTTVFFDPGTRIVIEGRMLAEGTEYELIRFTRTPATDTTAWNGLQFANTASDNRITYAVIEYGRTMDGMIGLTQSNLLLDHVTLDHTDRLRISTEDSSLIVRNSTFTNIFEFGEAPTGDNICEHIWGAAPAAGHFIIENNVFGTITGHNDAIDVDGNTRPAPVIQILNNLFLGGGDDALDLGGDAHIEGNVFTHYRKDVYNTGSGNANVISAGDGYDYVVVRNVFYDMDHVAQVKSDSFMTFVNNTVVDADISALYFLRPTSSTDYGRGAYVDGSIFRNTALLFDRFTGSTDLT
ncbi:MAG: CotH kinase family protein, partial [Planctomycetota bacterium]